MAGHDYTAALVALADFLAVGDPTLRRTIAEPGQKISLFAHVAEENDADDPYTVVRTYLGATAGNRPIGAMSIQLLTVGAIGAGKPSDSGTMIRAQVVHGRLLDTNRRPRQSFTTGGFFFHGIKDLRAPALVGRREGKVEFASNFDTFFKAV